MRSTAAFRFRPPAAREQPRERWRRFRTARPSSSTVSRSARCRTRSSAKRQRLRLVALVHHPLAAETGLDPARCGCARGERAARARRRPRAVVVTGRATAAALARYGVGRRAHRGRRAGHRPRAGRARLALDAAGLTPCELAMSVRRDADAAQRDTTILFRALAAIPHRHWRLTCAGSLDRDPATVERLRAHAATRAGSRIASSSLGELDAAALAVEYDRADLFVLPTLYEGYGMAVAEALARGLPVVSTATGSIPALVGDEAGIVVAPGDSGRVHRRADARASATARCAQRSRRTRDGVRDRLPTWDDARRGDGDASCAARPMSADRCRSVTGFSADWLRCANRRPARARSARLTQRASPTDSAARHRADCASSTSAPAPVERPLPRAASARTRQHWLLVDHDPALLAQVAVARRCAESMSRRGLLDLARSPTRTRAICSPAARLVTASALLDLVSEDGCARSPRAAARPAPRCCSRSATTGASTVHRTSRRTPRFASS